MADTEQIRQQVQSPAPFSTWLGVVLLMLLFGVMAVAIIGPGPRGNTYEQQRAQNREKKLKDLRDEDAKALAGYGWIDKNKGTVRLPIERAMQLTLADLANKKPTAAGPIATPAPEASAPPSGSPAPSPAGSSAAQTGGTPKPTSVAGQHSEAHGQPAAAINPPPTQPGTQPGTNSPPAPTPKSPGAAPAVSSSTTPAASPSSSPSPARGASPGQ